jgi:hypothetical protein
MRDQLGSRDDHPFPRRRCQPGQAHVWGCRLGRKLRPSGVVPGRGWWRTPVRWGQRFDNAGSAGELRQQARIAP